MLRGASASKAAHVDALLQSTLRAELDRLQVGLRTSMPENPAGYGFKVYSQCDEDGILDHLLQQAGIRAGTAVEIGCGNGTENNTHFLLLKGWRAVWIDGSAGNIQAIQSALPASNHLAVRHAFVDRDNAASIVSAELASLDSCDRVDVVSVDIDGNDLAVMKVILETFSPSVAIVEYNAKFPPPIRIGVGYRADHIWADDDYHGASLEALVEAFAPDHLLVSCNLAGTNAFFVHSSIAGRFKLLTVAELYQPARFHLTALRAGHPPSLKFLAETLRPQ